MLSNRTNPVLLGTPCGRDGVMDATVPVLAPDLQATPSEVHLSLFLFSYANQALQRLPTWLKHL